MKIKMPSGVILECDNDDINESRLFAGGVEVGEKPVVEASKEESATDEAPKNKAKKKPAKADKE